MRRSRQARSASCITSHATAGRRLDRLAAGDGLRARRARQAGPASSTPMPRPITTRSSPAWTRIEIARDVRADDADARDRDGVRATWRAPASRGSRAASSINIDHHAGQPHVRRSQLVRRVGRGVRRDGVRPHPRARRAADARDRHAHLPGDPHRHRLVPSLEHHAADVRHLPPGGRGGRESGGDGAAGVRQQQLRQAEADWRAARPDGAARRRPAGGALPGRRMLDASRLHAQRHRRADQPAADRARDSGGRVLQGRRRTATCGSACGRSTTSTCAASRTHSAAAATRTRPASRSADRSRGVRDGRSCRS